MSRRHKRRRGQVAIGGNPFVVFADITIALSFIFAVHGLATVASSSQALVLVRRHERQNKMRSDFLDALISINKGAHKGELPPGESDGSLKLYSSSEQPLADVWTHGNLLRIMVYNPVFTSQKSDTGQKATQLYKALGPVIKKYAKGLAYVFVHGIVEPREGLSGVDAVQVSRRRADNVMDILRDDRVVGPSSDPERVFDLQGKDMVAAKNAIPFGTGKDLYILGTNIGRVDLILFCEDDYMEKNEQRAN